MAEPGHHPTSEWDPTTLVERARRGDHQAFTELYERYVPLVEGLVRAETRDDGDVADLVQETFAKAWRQLAALSEPDRFRPWLLQIARRAVIDHSRMVRRRPQPVANGEAVLDLTASREPGPDELAGATDLADRVRSALSSMSERDAAAIAHSAQCCTSSAELAEVLELTPGNAKVILHRARRRLRALVA